MEFILHMDVKMTIVGILRFIYRINTTSECLKQEKNVIFLCSGSALFGDVP